MNTDMLYKNEHDFRKGVSVVLPDLIEKNLSIVFCGTAAGKRSASVNAYYAGINNKFWDVLYEVGLTPVKLESRQYGELLKYGIGLTDLVKHSFGNDNNLKKYEYDVERLKKTILIYKPKILAFNGKKAAKVFYGIKEVDYGLHKDKIGFTGTYILPSTSSQANRYWDNYYWKDVAKIV